MLALACALATNAGLLIRHRGAVAAPDVDGRHPLRSARGLFASKWWTIGWIGAVVAWLGFATLPWAAGPDPVPLAATDAGIPQDATARLLDTLSVIGPGGLEGTVFVAGHVLGTVLLGLALWRAVPRWAAVAIIVSQPLHFVAAVVLANHVLDAAAWALTAVGFAVAVAVARPART